MTAKKWTDEEVQAEIKNAVRIVTEDRERASYAQLHEKYGKEASGDPSGSDGGSNGDGKTPPKKEGETESDLEGSGKKRSLWWGEMSDE